MKKKDWFVKSAAVILSVVLFAAGLLLISTKVAFADVVFSPFILIGEILYMILPVIIGIVLIVVVTILIIHFKNKKRDTDKKEAVFRKDE